jgi:arsenate reductase
MKTTLFPNLQSFIEGLDISSISVERKKILSPLAAYISEGLISNKNINLNFICTHNSRRSHLGQIWAQTMATHFGIEKVFSYSGGTEATALYPQVVETLQSIGFLVNKISSDNNPVYSIKSGDNLPPTTAFSKKYDHHYNPKSDFAAALTCSQADQDCPLIIGATTRIPLDYSDPKTFDNTDLKAQKYMERCIQIATEMKFVFSVASSHD